LFISVSIWRISLGAELHNFLYIMECDGCGTRENAGDVDCRDVLVGCILR
jgi:hypothetical protein